MEKDLKSIEAMKIEKKVYRLRHRDGLKWHDVADKIKNEFNKSFTTVAVEEIYDTHVARAHVIKNSRGNNAVAAEQVGEAWVNEIKAIIEKIKKINLKHVEIANEKLLKYAEAEDEFADKNYFNYLPTMISVSRSLLDQASFLSKRLEKVEIVQNKLVLNETQILQIVNEAYAKKAKETGMTIHPGTGLLVPINNKHSDR